jgi:uncharacterized CHY-type Zn-finger protein
MADSDHEDSGGDAGAGETQCWRCHKDLFPAVNTDAETSDKSEKQLKCACCRREYADRQFNTLNRKRWCVGRRCLACSQADAEFHTQILEEDEYKKMQQERQDALEGPREKREERQHVLDKRAAERARSRARRNFRRDLDKRVEREFDRKRRQTQEELLSKQVAARMAAEMVVQELEREKQARLKATASEDVTGHDQ